MLQNLTYINFIGLKNINHSKCKLIIVSYISAWSASNSNVLSCLYLDIFSSLCSLLYHRGAMYRFVQRTDRALGHEFLNYCLHTWFSVQTYEVAAYMNYIFERRFVKKLVKLYLMSKLLRFLPYCFNIVKSKNEQAIGYHQVRC